VFEFVLDVASQAFHINVLTQYAESGFAMIKVERLPVYFFMAVLAFGSQRALVLVILGMTPVAGLLDETKLLGREMAVLAQNFAG